MAMREEIDLVLKTIGGEGVAELKAKYADLVTQLGEVTAAMGRDDQAARDLEADYQALSSSAKNLGSTIAQLEAAQAREAAEAQRAADGKVKAFDRAIAAEERAIAAQAREADAANREQARITDALDRRTSAARKAADASARSADDQATFFGRYRQNITAAGYALNDFTSVSGDLSARLNGVANNLPGVFMGLGNFGLLLSGLVPIGGMVIKNWDAIREAVTGAAREASGAVEALKGKIKELEDRKVLLAVDTRELDIARDKLKKLEEAQAAHDAGLKKQTAGEAEAGKQVGTALTEAPGGEEAVSGDVKANLVKQFTATSLPLKAAGAEAEAFRKLVEAARKQFEESTDLEERAAAMEAVRKFTDEETAARDRALAIRLAIVKNAEQEFGDAKRRATEGHGLDMEEGRIRLAQLVADTGRADLAKKILESTAAEAKWWKDAEESAKTLAELMDEDAKGAKKAGDERQKAQREAIDTAVKSNALDADADRHAVEINAKGLTAEGSFQALKAKIQDDIIASLRRQGVATEGAAEVAAPVAGQQAEQAFGRVGRAGQKAGKDAARRAVDDAKVDRKAAEDVALGRAKLDEQRARAFEAEGKQHEAAVGKPLAERFQAVMGQNARALQAGGGFDPQALAQQLRREMVAMLQQQRGATAGGAEAAAEAIAQRGQLALDRQMFAPPPQPQPGRRRPRGFQSVPPAPVPEPRAPVLDPRSPPPVRPKPAAAAQAQPAAGGLAGGILAVQADQAAMQGVDARLAREIATIKQNHATNARRNAQNFAQLNGRNEPMQPSALPFGYA